MSDSSQVISYEEHARSTVSARVSSCSSEDDWAVALEQEVRLADLHEGDSDLAVLRLAARDREVVAQGDGDEAGEVLAREVRRRVDRARALIQPAQEPRALTLLAQPLGRDGGGGLGADNDLTRAREILELEDPCRGRPGDDQLAVGAGGEEEVAEARVDAGGHAEADRPDRALRRADRLDRPLHVRRRAAGALHVPVAGEEQQQRVAAELQDVAAVALGDRDQLREDGGDARDELLGATACRATRAALRAP